MGVLCLTNGLTRRVQAGVCFREALRLGLSDVELLEELGDLYFKEESTLLKAI